MILQLIFVLVALCVGMELVARIYLFIRQGMRGRELFDALFKARLSSKKEKRFQGQANWMGMGIGELHQIMGRASGVSVEEVDTVYGSPEAFEKYNYRPYQGFVLQPEQKLSYTTIDSFGFQSGISDFRKNAGVKRVVVLGGSVAFGIGATRSEAIWTRVLERLLNDAGELSSSRWEVINMAYVASESHAEMNRAVIYATMFEPDYIVQLSGFNDLYFFLEHKKLYTFNFYDRVYKALAQTSSSGLLGKGAEYSAIMRLTRALVIKGLGCSAQSSKLDRDMIYTVW